MISLVKLRCPRCGKSVYGTATPIYDSSLNRQLQAQYRGLCGDCMTPEEEAEMCHKQGQGVQQCFAGGQT